MLALIPCIGPVIALLLGIPMMGVGLAPTASAAIMKAVVGLTPLGAVMLCAIF